MPALFPSSIQHPVTLAPQRTDMTCWSAATTMLFGTRFTAGPGRATLSKSGGLASDIANVREFAASHQLRFHAPQSWSVAGLHQLLARGPVAMLGALPSMHAVVIGGIKTDGSTRGTELTIYDPWPPNVGATYRVNYEILTTRLPLATMYLLQR